MSETLLISEIYMSLQGESTFAGLPCVFVRLTGCNLRCSFCDSAYAFSGGRRLTVAEVCDAVRELAGPFRRPRVRGRTRAVRRPGAPGPLAVAGPLPLVELTGGEPLLQRGALPLMAALCDAGYTVLLETSGALDISRVDARVRRIMDLKCPGSGEVRRNRWANLRHLTSTDEVKFVIGSREDYAWARRQLARHGLARRCPVLFSWAAPLRARQRDPSLRPLPANRTPLSQRELAELIVADALPVRFQLQLHKFIWPPDRRGV